MAKKDLLPGVRLPTPFGPEEEVPGPPQPEEFFPGFREELRLVTQERYRAGKALSAHGQKSTNVILSMMPDWFRPIAAAGMLPYMGERFIPEEMKSALLEENRLEFENLTLAYNVISWKQTVMFDLPYFLADRLSEVSTVDDVVAKIPPRFDLTDADRAWLQNLFDKVSYLIPEELPEEYRGTPEDVRAALLEDILTSPDVEMRAVHNMTVEELEKAFLALYGIGVPELPPNVTAADIRTMLSDYEIEDEDLHEYVEERQKAWRTESAYTDLLRAGLEQAEAPDLTTIQFMKMLATQPMLASVELLNKYFNILPRPLSAMAIINFPRINPDSDAVQLEEIYQQYRDLGEGVWSAYALAFQDWEYNPWLKLLIEALYDPTTYIGLGVATKIFKPIPRLGRMVGAFERGWLELWDVPFRGARGMIKKIPRTPPQMANRYARHAYMDGRAYFRRMYGKGWQGASAAELDDAVKFAIKQAADMPYETGNLAVRFGRYLTDYDIIEAGVVKSWFDDAGIKGIRVTPQLTHDVNYHFGLFFNKSFEAKEAAINVLAHANVTATDDMVTKLSKVFTHHRATILDTAADALRGNTGGEMLRNLLRSVENRQLVQMASPVYKFAQQSGRITSWITRAVDKVVRNNLITWIDRHITAPMANQYLLFTNYGPFNVLENSMRSFLGGGDVFYPRNASPVDEVVRIGEGLTNLPYEFIRFQRELGRLEMAVPSLRTGETMVFSKGMVPGITKELPQGFTIRIGAKNYNMRCWQHWNDMFGDIGTRQRAHYFTTKYKQILHDVAPDEMEMLARVFDDSEHLLAPIKTFNKRERADLVRVLQQDATVGPDMVRAHDIPILELERRKAALEINKTLDKCTDIYSIHKRLIREQVLDGSMFKDIDGSITLIGDSIREFNVVGLQAEARTLRNLTKEMASFVPENADEVLRTMGFLSDLTEAVSERVSDVRMITRTRAAALTPKEADAFHRASSEILGDFLGVSQREIDNMLDGFRLAVRKKALLKADQSVALDNLIEAVRLRNANALSTRELDRRIINEAVATTPPGKRDKAFWDMLETKRGQQAWEPYWTRETELFEAIEDLKNGFMVSVGVTPQAVPTMVPQVPGKLAPAHVAYMLGVTGDDLNRALTKTGAMVTIRPKNKFVAYIYSKAKKMAANVGKLPEDIGFSRAAIGDVYDQMFRNLGIDPLWAGREPLVPAMAQLEDVRQDLHRLYITKKIPENDYILYKSYINSIADDLDRLPMYRGLAEPTLEGSVGSDVISKVTDLNADFYKLIDKHFRYLIPDYNSYILSGKPFKKVVETMAGDEQFLRGVRTALKRAGVPDTVTVYHGARKGMRPTGEFTNVTLNPSMADDLKKFKHPPVPEEDWVVTAYRVSLDDISGVGIANESELFIRVSKLRKPFVGKAPATQAWWAKKETAMAKTRVQYEMDFTDYSNRNAVDAAMRTVFPFWTYEWQRWFWLPRAFLKHPGIATGLARYYNYSDGGYIPIPGTDIQFSPLRGTVFMGGFRRLYLRDYPEYYDAFPGMEVIDYISRVGFYPGINVMLPIVITGAARGKPELGEILPAWVRTGLDAARAVAPEQAGKVIEHVFPDRFRDYLTMLTLGEMGYDADAIWKKREAGKPLTEEEEKLWLRAQNRAVGIKGMLFEQTGVFRLRPPEYTQMMEDMSKLIEEMTGVPVRVQEEIRRRYPVTGKRFGDYYKLDALQQKILYEMESYKRWQGVTTALYPSTWQAQDIRRSEYYETVDNIFDDSRRKGVFDSEGNLIQPSLQEVTRQWVAGEIGPDQWVSMRGEILDGASDATNEVGNRLYPDVPKTLEEMEEFYKSRGTLPPIKSPDQEIMYIYYQLKPEYRWNWDKERFEYDFDTYYALIDAMISTLKGEFKQRFLDRIQYDWLPMERLYWEISREYLRPYRLVRNAVLEGYPPELQKLIMRFEVARGQERQAIMDVVGPDGRKLISGFNSQLREARQRLRMIDPELDAWCYFFGVTDTLLSAEATEIYDRFKKEHLTPAAYE